MCFMMMVVFIAFVVVFIALRCKICLLPLSCVVINWSLLKMYETLLLDLLVMFIKILILSIPIPDLPHLM